MWADLRSSQPSIATTPPGSRPYTPASRRGTNLPPGPASLPPRPGLYPRSSSLSIASTPNASTASLPSTARYANGSSLRNEIRNPTPEDVPDPLHTLRTIIGISLKQDDTNDSGLSLHGRPEELAEDIDFEGLSLAAFVQRKDDGQSRSALDVHSHTDQSIQEYDKVKERFEDLHKSITACDQVLQSVEKYLTGFQADLGAVSAEIEMLQTRSTAMNTKLENRRVVEKLLGPSVEDLSLSPAVVRKISEGPIDDGWIRALVELEKRSKAVQSKQKDQQKLKALDDLLPLLDNLTKRAVERIRNYFVDQIKSIRHPNINAQIIQQDAFLKYKSLYAFLAHHQPKLAEDIGLAYVNTMRWYYLNHFTRYDAALKSMKLYVLDKNDAMGQQDDPTVRKTGKMGSATSDPFSLGRRLDVLRAPTRNALTSHLVEEDKSPHYLELPFRSFNLALIDNASFEYTFLSTFFAPSQNFHAISRTFNNIFAPTFAIGQALTKYLVENSADALGILLCVRLNQQMAFELQRRKIPAAEGYVNGTNIQLWPRFQMIMDMHCESLKRATTAISLRTGASSLLTGGGNQSQAVQSAAPHPLTQRFASFMLGILSLSSEAGDDEPVPRSLGRLRSEYEAFLTKLSKSVGDARKRERFLFNNYSLVGTILENAEGKLADDSKEHFADLKETFEAGA